MNIVRHIALLTLLSTLIAACQSLPEGVSPVAASWLYGNHTLPATATVSGKTESFVASYTDKPWTASAEKVLQAGLKLPIAVYLHGCRGIDISAEDGKYRALLLSLGYGVVMPDSFQRPGRAVLCGQGGMRERIALRTAEAAYALKRIRELSWVDQKRVILLGFSEGGNAVDNWRTNDFSGLVILGSACTHSGGSPAAPAEVPVLAIVGEDDEYRPGLSCRIERTVGGSKSIIVPGAGHTVAAYPQTRQAIKQFLQQCCSPHIL